MSSSEAGQGEAADWRAMLRDHARHAWSQDGGRGDPPPAVPAELDLALGPLAQDAARIVAAYATGARGNGKDAPPPEFASGLEIVLNGIEASLHPPPAFAFPSADARPHVVQSELWQLLRMIRESAELAYSREQFLIELDRRIIFRLQEHGPLVPAELSSTVGVDKAQVSRSVRRLLDMRLVEREQIRAPLALTRDGERLSKRLLRMADLRNRELTLDVSERELAEFFANIEILLDRAMALYEQERALAQGGTSGRARLEEARPGEKLPIDRSRVVSPLLTLSAYVSRSGALAFKRLTGLSNFEAFVLSEIGMDPPIDWGSLVNTLARDHSQASRTVTALMERGLVRREGKPGRRHGRFFPSDAGAKLFEVIHEAGRQRSAFLLAPLAAEQRARFLATFEKLRRNAASQLDRERAFAEFDRP